MKIISILILRTAIFGKSKKLHYSVLTYGMLALQITPALRVFFCIDIYGDRIYNKGRKIYGDRT